MKARYNYIQEHGAYNQGRTELLKHLNKESISKNEAIKAKCYDCMGYGIDGRIDCKVVTCPLYPWMPYKKGGAKKTRILSEEHKKKIASNWKVLHTVKSDVK